MIKLDHYKDIKQFANIPCSDPPFSFLLRSLDYIVALFTWLEYNAILTIITKSFMIVLHFSSYKLKNFLSPFFQSTLDLYRKLLTSNICLTILIPLTNICISIVVQLRNLLRNFHSFSNLT